MNIVFLGPPGVGKGTQAKKIAEHLKVPHIATGDMFRENLQKQTELGKKAQEFMDKGELVPDDVVIAMVKDRLTHDDCKEGFVLDGFPRTIAQADALGGIVKIDKVINYTAPDETVVERIAGRAKKEGRSDDTPETVQKRLDVYHEQTSPLIFYFRKKQILTDVDATGTVEEVFDLTKKAVGG